MGKQKETTPDKKTEELILDAARRVFTRKGFAAARMEDIAKEAGMNRALLHYYFRSKEKMFDLIFDENLKKFFENFLKVLKGKETFEDKIRKLINSEIEMLLQNQELPLFIISEIAQDPERIKEKLKHLPAHAFRNELAGQIQSEIKKGNIKKTDPRQLIINIIALCIWPFVAKPMLMAMMEFDQEEFETMMKKRKTFVADTIIDSIKK